jgi:predicted O-linked N-acetylglucosamine transferase (SPINDLY family)
VLWLLDPGTEMRNEVLKVLENIKNRIFFAENAEISEHLGRVGYANLFLDSFPYGAHTTASDAVFRGVPLLARSGESFQSRVAQSIIHYAGLTDMWAGSWDDFIEKGVNFYKGFNEANAMWLKTMLLDQDRDRHPYNIEWTTSQIEKAYKQILN